MSNTANLFTHHDRGVLDASIALPAPEAIGNKAIRSAVAALIEAVDRQKRNQAERRAGEARVLESREADLRTVDAAVQAGEDLPADLHELEHEAEAALERITAQTEPLNRLYAGAYHDVEKAIAESGTEWAVTSARTLEKDLDILVSLRRQVEAVSASIQSAYGVVTLATKGVDYKAGRQIMSVQDNEATLPLEHAVTALGDSLQKVAARIEVAKTAAAARSGH